MSSQRYSRNTPLMWGVLVIFWKLDVLNLHVKKSWSHQVRMNGPKWHKQEGGSPRNSGTGTCAGGTWKLCQRSTSCVGWVHTRHKQFIVYTSPGVLSGDKNKSDHEGVSRRSPTVTPPVPQNDGFGIVKTRYFSSLKVWFVKNRIGWHILFFSFSTSWRVTDDVRKKKIWKKSSM